MTTSYTHIGLQFLCHGCLITCVYTIPMSQALSEILSSLKCHQSCNACFQSSFWDFLCGRSRKVVPRERDVTVCKQKDVRGELAVH